jgi:DNA-binding NarL/FixJ family response regulator
MNWTPREIDILQRVAAGGSNASIASELGLSPLTVKELLRLCYAKHGFPNRAAAAVAFTCSRNMNTGRS